VFSYFVHGGAGTQSFYEMKGLKSNYARKGDQSVALSEIELTGKKLDLDEIAASGFCALGSRNGVDARGSCSVWSGSW
jgi:hypothetical protein